MRISDWSSDVCSSDLRRKRIALNAAQVEAWRCIFAPFRRDVEAGHLRCNRRQVGEIEFRYRLGAERRDRGRHVDQRLLPLLRRNDNFILSLSPGRRSGRYQRSNCDRSSDQSPRSSQAQFPMGAQFALPSYLILKKQAYPDVGLSLTADYSCPFSYRE